MAGLRLEAGTPIPFCWSSRLRTCYLLSRGWVMAGSCTRMMAWAEIEDEIGETSKGLPCWPERKVRSRERTQAGRRGFAAAREAGAPVWMPWEESQGKGTPWLVDGGWMGPKARDQLGDCCNHLGKGRDLAWRAGLQGGPGWGRQPLEVPWGRF